MTQTRTIEQIDRALAPVEAGADTVWYDIRDLGVEGRGWSDVASYYDRLPARAKDVVRPDVWTLSEHSTGMMVRFVAETPSIAARWTLRSPLEGLAMPHMPATGVSGLDLYGRIDGRWHHAGTGRPNAVQASDTLVGAMAPVSREYLLYLPLYNGVESVHIGLPPTAKISKALPRRSGRDKPIVIYGTSVTQGGCASRPGMVYSSILGRWLNMPMINLGFSGNGRMEVEVARFLAELDPSIFVVDCLGNCTEAQITERTEPVVRTLRDARPAVPIVLVGSVPYCNRAFKQDSEHRFTSSNAALKAAFDRLVAAGVTGLHHVPATDFYGDDSEATVDGAHATDLGFLRIAQAFAPALRKLL